MEQPASSGGGGASLALAEESEPDPDSRLRALLGRIGGLFFPETPDPVKATAADDSLLSRLRETPIGRWVLPSPPEGIGWLMNLIRALGATLAIFGTFRFLRPRRRGSTGLTMGPTH